MSDNKDILVEMLKTKNKYLNKFSEITDTYLEAIYGEIDDLGKAEKFSVMVDLRDEVILKISDLQEKISGNPELLKIYESDDTEVLELRNIFNKKKGELEQQQVHVNGVGRDIEGLMKEEFRKINEAKKVNTAYLDHGDLGGKFNYKQ